MITLRLAVVEAAVDLDLGTWMEGGPLEVPAERSRRPAFGRAATARPCCRPEQFHTGVVERQNTTVTPLIRVN